MSTSLGLAAPLALLIVPWSSRVPIDSVAWQIAKLHGPVRNPNITPQDYYYHFEFREALQDSGYIQGIALHGVQGNWGRGAEKTEYVRGSRDGGRLVQEICRWVQPLGTLPYVCMPTSGFWPTLGLVGVVASNGAAHGLTNSPGWVTCSSISEFASYVPSLVKLSSVMSQLCSVLASPSDSVRCSPSWLTRFLIATSCFLQILALAIFL